MQKIIFSALAGATMLVAAAAGAEPAKHMDGTLMNIDAKAGTVVVAGRTFAVLGSIQELSQGQRVTATYVGDDAWLALRD